MRLALPILVVALLAGCTQSEDSDDEPTTSPLPDVTMPGAVLHTDQGDITWVFYPDAAPVTVGHISGLIADGYYDGKHFGRVVPGHVIQQVEPDGGQATDDKRTIPLEVPPGYHFSAGAVGIARGADPGSGGPEFFIMDYATSHLDGNYTVFAQVVSGLDVVHRIARVQSITFPAEAQLITDRMALVPVAITDADLVDLTLEGEVAARLPMQVARNVRTGDFRHSLEWPHDVAAGRESAFTWYVRPYNETPSLDPTRLTLSIDGDPVPLTPQPGLPDILAFRWTPAGEGAHAATLSLDGQALATLTVPVEHRP